MHLIFFKEEGRGFFIYILLKSTNDKIMTRNTKQCPFAILVKIVQLLYKKKLNNTTNATRFEVNTINQLSEECHLATTKRAPR